VSEGFVYVSGERRPVEVLVFRVERIPFLSKEVWLDDSRPGEVTLVFVWETMEQWDAVGRPEIQSRLQAQFDARFPHPVTLVRALHEDSGLGIHRVSRFERTEENP